MTDLSQVTYCGLYCGLCSSRNRTPKQACELRDGLRAEAIEYWGPGMSDFNEFWRFLEGLTTEERCSCRAGTCGPPFCTIRKCAPSKGVEVCPFCDEYPCDRILGLAKGYVMMLADGARMKEIGLDNWIEEQEKRRATGFAYVDIRCEPYDVPDK
jgi:Protein of unknown function (DUF3795)